MHSINKKSLLKKAFTHPWVLLIVRLIPGAVFFLFALGKAVEDHGVFYEAVRQYALLPEWSVPFLSTSLIYIELGVGLLLILGLFTRPMMMLSSAMLVMFIVFIVQALLRGIPLTDCGCAGGFISLGDTPAQVITRDIVLLGFLAWGLIVKQKSALRLDVLFEESGDDTDDTAIENQA